MSAPRKVLVVDDENVVAEMICEFLERQGLRATHCNDAAQAVIQLEALKPALLIMDIMMPIWGSGLDAYKRLRASKGFQKTPVIFLTGMQIEQAKRLVPLGDPFTRLLHKPVRMATLMQTIRDLTGDRLLPPAVPGKGAPNG
ncbi:MAG: response regulator [Elusimicrobia bacterium]|nr:response regulator [Elusimicrobiota bacterium]